MSACGSKCHILTRRERKGRGSKRSGTTSLTIVAVIHESPKTAQHVRHSERPPNVGDKSCEQDSNQSHGESSDEHKRHKQQLEHGRDSCENDTAQDAHNGTRAAVHNAGEGAGPGGIVKLGIQGEEMGKGHKGGAPPQSLACSRGDAVAGLMGHAGDNFGQPVEEDGSKGGTGCFWGQRACRGEQVHCLLEEEGCREGDELGEEDA